ncbi:MAG: DUF2752 domain-containing protein [Mariniblastus sp.]|nr:DUF2752 domain-containing protein [Mariniblastus sp.]
MSSQSHTNTPTAPLAESVQIVLDPKYVRSETAVHFIFLIMAAIVLLLSFLMRSEGETSVFLPGFSTAMPETCSARRLLGIDCPGCGMTRAFISISAGQFARAWHFNPVSFAFYLFVVAQIPWHLIQISRLRKQRYPITTAWAYLAPILMVVILTAHWIWKLLTQIG